MKTITPKQIEELFKFTHQHFVEWYDLQCELVDHLANDIEQIWLTQPDLTFEQVRQQAFKRFGVFGFMEIVDKKRGTMEKRYRKLVWQECVAYFKIPKILLTLSVIMGVVVLFRLVEHNPLVVGLIGLFLMLFPMFFAFGLRREIAERQKQSGYKYMFEDGIMSLGGLLSFFNLPIQIFVQFQFLDVSGWGVMLEFGVATLFVLFSLFAYVSVAIIPHRVVKILKQEHPEYRVL